ncbi:MAG TPA: hypothetical protein VM639_01550 [Dongiaceae bacterium]|nr:hypothetical protein [Dongiaceae bacterium]
MPRYRILELSYIGDRLQETDVEIDYDGLPGSNLLPLDAAARKAAKAASALSTLRDESVETDGEEAAPLDLN